MPTTNYVIETLDRDGRVTHSDEHATALPDGAELSAWEATGDGGDCATGTAPAYLGGEEIGRCRIRVYRA